MLNAFCLIQIPLVLLGRGKPFQSHYGNIRLHKLVNENRERYLGASRDEKNSIAKTIVHNIKVGVDGESSGRFLKRAGDGRDFWYVQQQWLIHWSTLIKRSDTIHISSSPFRNSSKTLRLECTDVVARQKVGHALRGMCLCLCCFVAVFDIDLFKLLSHPDVLLTLHVIVFTGKPRRGEFAPRKGDVSPQAAIICDDDPRATIGKAENKAPEDGKEAKRKATEDSPTLASTEASARAKVGLVEGRSPLLPSVPASAAVGGQATVLADPLTRPLYGQSLSHLHYDPYAIHLRGPARATLPGRLSALAPLGLPISDPHVQYLGSAPLAPHLVSSRAYPLGHYRVPPPPVARLAVPHAPPSSLHVSAIEMERHRQEEELYRQQLKRPLVPAQEEERIDKRLKEDLSVAQELINLAKK